MRLAAFGATVIDADRIAHEVLAEESVVAALEERFGPGVLDPQGRVARRRIAERVFGPGPDGVRELAWLEALVHTRVHRRSSRAEAKLETNSMKLPRSGYSILSGNGIGIG